MAPPSPSRGNLNRNLKPLAHERDNPKEEPRKFSAASRTLTILQYITPSRIGGAETYFLRMVRFLAESGHRVIVVTKRDAVLRQELERMQLPNLQVHGWLTRGKVDPATVARLMRLIRREKVDLIHTHLTTASLLGAIAGRLTKRPVVCHVHGNDSKTYFQFGNYLIAVAQGVKEHLLAQGIPAAKIPVLYYGVDLQKYDHPLPPAEAKELLALPRDAKTVGVVASLQERKGHRFLLEALAQIEPQVGPVHALFAGEGPEEGALREQALQLNMAERVHFLGFRDDVNAVVAACDVVALPSRKEGLSIAVMEAMALRRPVIATRIAGMPELVKDGETGLLVTPFETEPLAAALESLLTNAELRVRLAERGRDFLEERFDQRECLARVESFLTTVVQSWQNGTLVNGADWHPDR